MKTDLWVFRVVEHQQGCVLICLRHKGLIPHGHVPPQAEDACQWLVFPQAVKSHSTPLQVISCICKIQTCEGRTSNSGKVWYSRGLIWPKPATTISIAVKASIYLLCHQRVIVPACLRRCHLDSRKVREGKGPSLLLLSVTFSSLLATSCSYPLIRIGPLVSWSITGTATCHIKVQWECVTGGAHQGSAGDLRRAGKELSDTVQKQRHFWTLPAAARNAQLSQTWHQVRMHCSCSSQARKAYLPKNTGTNFRAMTALRMLARSMAASMAGWATPVPEM